MALKQFIPTLFTTKEAVEKTVVSQQTLRGYRKDNILKKGVVTKFFEKMCCKKKVL